jgi:lipopolysaccharide biosynthesis glycosyltransferase
MRPIHVAVAFDRRFVPFAGVAIASLIASGDTARRHVLHIFVADVPRSELAWLSAISHPGWSIRVYDLPSLATLARPGYPIHPVTYARLLLPDLLPDVERLLYLDVDIVATAPWSALHDCDLSGQPLGAVTDFAFEAGRVVQQRVLEGGCTGLPAEAYCTNVLGLPPRGHGSAYINAGVLVMDFDRLRAMDFTRQARNILARKTRFYWFGDQCCLNEILAGRYCNLDPRWNAMPTRRWRVIARYLPKHRANLRQSVRQPRIAHYAGLDKPWLAAEPRHADRYFWATVLGAPTRDRILVGRPGHGHHRVAGSAITIEEVRWMAGACSTQIRQVLAQQFVPR